MQILHVASFLFAFFSLGLLTSSHVVDVAKRQTSAASEVESILSSLSASLSTVKPTTAAKAAASADDDTDPATLVSEIVSALNVAYEDFQAISALDVYPINTNPQINAILQAVVSDTVSAAQTIQLQAQTEYINLSNDIDTAFSQGLTGLEQLVPEVLSAIEVFLQTVLQTLEELDLELTIAVIDLYTDL